MTTDIDWRALFDQAMNQLGARIVELEDQLELQDARVKVAEDKVYQQAQRAGTYVANEEALMAQLLRQEAALRRLRDIADHMDPRPRKVMTAIIDDALSAPPEQEDET